MALLYAEGFDHFSHWIDGSGLGAGSSLGADEVLVPGRGGSGYALRRSYSPPDRSVEVFDDQMYVGVAIRVVTSPNSYRLAPYYWYAGGGTLLSIGWGQFQITYDGTGKLSITRGTALATTSTPVVSPGVWAYYEVSLLHAVAGFIEVRVNGVSVLSVTTDTSFCLNDFYLATGGGNDGIDYDDIYVCDGTGGVNDNFLGDITVRDQLPNGTGSSTQFVPVGSASNWANVNVYPLTETTFNRASVSGHRDTYALTDLTDDGQTIFAVQVALEYVRAEGGFIFTKPAVKSNSTVAVSTDTSDSRKVWDVDPHTSAAWIYAAVNALEAGAEVT